MRNRDNSRRGRRRSVSGPPQSVGVLLQMGLLSRFVTLTGVVEPAWSGLFDVGKNELAQYLI